MARYYEAQSAPTVVDIYRNDNIPMGYGE